MYLAHPKHVQNQPCSSAVRGNRWASGDESGPNTFLAMPYFPFLSSCAGYGNHMSFSKLVESHPDCSLVRKLII